jgi:hypothetical protein
LIDLCHKCSGHIALHDLNECRVGPAGYCRKCYDNLPIDRCPECAVALEEGKTVAKGGFDYCRDCAEYIESWEAAIYEPSHAKYLLRQASSDVDDAHFLMDDDPDDALLSLRHALREIELVQRHLAHQREKGVSA